MRPLLAILRAWLLIAKRIAVGLLLLFDQAVHGQYPPPSYSYNPVVPQGQSYGPSALAPAVEKTYYIFVPPPAPKSGPCFVQLIQSDLRGIAPYRQLQRRLEDTPDDEMTVETEQECVQACSMDSVCASAVYDTSLKTCSLFDLIAGNPPSGVIPAIGKNLYKVRIEGCPGREPEPSISPPAASTAPELGGAPSFTPKPGPSICKLGRKQIKIPGKRLVGFAYSTDPVDSFEACVAKCVAELPKCRSGTYSSQTSLCILTNVDRNERPDLLLDAADDDRSIVYFEPGCPENVVGVPATCNAYMVIQDRKRTSVTNSKSLRGVTLSSCKAACDQNLAPDRTPIAPECSGFTHTTNVDGSTECIAYSLPPNDVQGDQFLASPRALYWRKFCLPGLVSCPNPSIGVSPNAEPAGDLLVRETASVGSLEACVKECISTESSRNYVCLAAVYTPKYQRCELSTSNPTQGIRPAPGRFTIKNGCAQPEGPDLLPSGPQGSAGGLLEVQREDFALLQPNIASRSIISRSIHEQGLTAPRLFDAARGVGHPADAFLSAWSAWSSCQYAFAANHNAFYRIRTRACRDLDNDCWSRSVELQHCNTRARNIYSGFNFNTKS